MLLVGEECVKDMMSELEKNFGGSGQIVTSVLNEI